MKLNQDVWDIFIGECLPVSVTDTRKVLFYINTLFFLPHELLMRKSGRRVVKMSLHIPQASCKSQPSVNWFCFTHWRDCGSFRPPISYRWHPYVGSICELAGSVWRSDAGAGWPMNWDTSTQWPDCCQQGRNRKHQSPSLW